MTRPEGRSRGIPRPIQIALRAMVRGADGDEAMSPLNMIAAAKLAGIPGHRLREYLTKPTARAFLMGERKAFLSEICGGNEASLKDIRDKSGNAMARVCAIKALEELNADERNRSAAASMRPGLTIRIVPAIPPRPAALTIDAKALEHDEATVKPGLDADEALT